mgnify:CR=1 FL=1
MTTIQLLFLPLVFLVYLLNTKEENLTNAINIIERSPSVVFLWKNLENWPVAYVSKNAHQLFGYASEEFLSGTINYKELIHSDDVSRILEELANINNWWWWNTQVPLS